MLNPFILFKILASPLKNQIYFRDQNVQARQWFDLRRVQHHYDLDRWLADLHPLPDHIHPRLIGVCWMEQVCNMTG
jgi:hypothetical protein